MSTMKVYISALLIIRLRADLVMYGCELPPQCSAYDCVLPSFGINNNHGYPELSCSSGFTLDGYYCKTPECVVPTPPPVPAPAPGGSQSSPAPPPADGGMTVPDMDFDVVGPP